MTKLITILGPTASGKTSLACDLAIQLEGEIISADSRQVYKDMDIGTGKDLDEYTVDGIRIPYHLIDIIPAGYRYHLGEFQRDFIAAFHQIIKNQHVPILCGGSGLYIETALQGQSFLGIPNNAELRGRLALLNDEELDKEVGKIGAELLKKLPVQTFDRKIRAIEIFTFLSENPDFNPVKQPEFEAVIVGIDIPREIRRERITKRLKSRLKHGMIEEVEALFKAGLSKSDVEYYGLEYKWIGKFLTGEIDRTTLFEQLNIAIHQFSKRQLTWFRGMERRGFKINWIDGELAAEEKVKKVIEILNVP